MLIKKNFLDKNADRNMIKSRNKTNLALPSLALIAIGLSFISPEWSSLVYFALFFLRRDK